MTPHQLTKDIGAGKFKPVYYFFGDEDYRKTEALKYILNHYIPSKEQQMLNLTKVSAASADLETIIGEMAAIPMLGERRVFFVDEVQRLSPTQQKALYTFLATPPPETIVVLSSPAAHTPKKSSAFFREVSKAAVTVRFDKLSGDTARLKIVRELEAAGFTYEEEAVTFLVALTNGDFGGLVGELQKLSLSSEAGGHIGRAEVKALASSHEDFNIFEMIDFVAEKRLDRALTAYNELLLRGIKPVSVLWLMAGQMVGLLKIHAGRKVAGNPYYIEKLRKQARSFDSETVVRAISGIARAERDIRHSRLEPSILVENLIRDISR